MSLINDIKKRNPNIKALVKKSNEGNYGSYSTTNSTRNANKYIKEKEDYLLANNYKKKEEKRFHTRYWQYEAVKEYIGSVYYWYNSHTRDRIYEDELQNLTLFDLSKRVKDKKRQQETENAANKLEQEKKMQIKKKENEEQALINIQKEKEKQERNAKLQQEKERIQAERETDEYKQNLDKCEPFMINHYKNENVLISQIAGTRKKMRRRRSAKSLKKRRS